MGRRVLTLVAGVSFSVVRVVLLTNLSFHEFKKSAGEIDVGQLPEAIPACTTAQDLATANCDPAWEILAEEVKPGK